MPYAVEWSRNRPDHVGPPLAAIRRRILDFGWTRLVRRRFGYLPGAAVAAARPSAAVLVLGIGPGAIQRLVTHHTPAGIKVCACRATAAVRLTVCVQKI
jgi:hypothetical protein